MTETNPGTYKNLFTGIYEDSYLWTLPQALLSTSTALTYSLSFITVYIYCWRNKGTYHSPLSLSCLNSFYFFSNGCIPCLLCLRSFGSAVWAYFCSVNWNLFYPLPRANTLVDNKSDLTLYAYAHIWPYVEWTHSLTNSVTQTHSEGWGIWLLLNWKKKTLWAVYSRRCLCEYALLNEVQMVLHHFP